MNTILIILLMILTAALESLRVYYGLEEMAWVTQFSNMMVLLVVSFRAFLILSAFLVQQYESKT
jgi:hypothetical protein